jgi:hypothetical protein
MPLSLSQKNVSCEWDAASISYVTRDMTWARLGRASFPLLPLLARMTCAHNLILIRNHAFTSVACDSASDSASLTTLFCTRLQSGRAGSIAGTLVSTCIIQLWLAGLLLGSIVTLICHPQTWQFLGENYQWPVSIVLIIAWHVTSQIILNKYVTDGKRINWPFAWLFLYFGLSATYCVVCIALMQYSSVLLIVAWIEFHYMLQHSCLCSALTAVLAVFYCSASIDARSSMPPCVHALGCLSQLCCSCMSQLPNTGDAVSATELQVAVFLALWRLVYLTLTSILALSRLDKCLFTVLKGADRGYASFLAMALMLHSLQVALYVPPTYLGSQCEPRSMR